MRLGVRPAGVPRLAEAGQRLDVLAAQRRQDQARRQNHAGEEPPARQHRVDERPPHPAVAVREGVDRLELGVHERRLDERGMGGAVEVRQQIRDEIRHQLGRRRHEVGVQRVVGGAPHPVLGGAGAVVLGGVGQQAAVEGQQTVGGHRLRAGELLHRRAHECHIAGDGAGLLAQPPDLLLLRQLGQGDPVGRRRHPLDPGGGDRLAAQEEPCDPRHVRQGAEGPHARLRPGRQRLGARTQDQGGPHQGVGNVRPVLPGAPVPAAQAALVRVLPEAGDPPSHRSSSRCCTTCRTTADHDMLMINVSWIRPERHPDRRRGRVFRCGAGPVGD